MRKTLLKRRTPLKRKTPLNAHKGLNKMSAKTKAELEIWMPIKKDRMEKLRDKFGVVICELCGKPIDYNSELYYPEAHHNDHNRRNNTPDNCRILHRVCNQRVEDENIKDVPSRL